MPIVIEWRPGPSAANAYVDPPTFLSGATITARYTYLGDYPEVGSKIRWYKNGIYQSAYDDQRSFVVTGQRGDTWLFYVTPCDSYGCGDKVESLPGVMLNNPPTPPTRVEIIPHNPQTTDDLYAVVSGSTDIDGDTITYHIKWYRTRNGTTTELLSYRNKTSISYTEVDEGDVFSIEAKAFDGESESE